MIRQKTENEMIYNSRSRWQNMDTGEIIETDEVIKKTLRNGFMITYLTAIVQLIDTLGNKKMQVVKYILNNMDKSTNTLIITTQELADKSLVSKKTVIETLKTLEQAQIVTRRTGAIMIHPSLVHRGKDTKEKYLLARFQDFSNNKAPINEVE